MNPQLIAAFVLTLLCSCSQIAQKESSDRAAILLLHARQKTHHMEKMADSLAEQMSAQFISVNRGEITMPSKQETTARFSNYLGRVTFEKWDDIEPPIIRFSADSTVAYTVVHKQVILTYQDEEDQQIRESTEFAWVTIYRKTNGVWKVECITSTNKPSMLDPEG